MRDRSKTFHEMAENYSAIRSGESFQSAETLSEKMGRTFKRRVIIFLLANIGIILMLLFVLLIIAGAATAIYLIFSDTQDSGSQQYQPSYVNGIDYKTFFSSEAKDIPFGIPVERAIIGVSIDQRKFGPQDSYGLASYKGHTGQDFPRVFKDKISGYYPFIFSTHDGVVLVTDTRIQDSEKPNSWLYTRNIYREGSYISYTESIKKSVSDSLTVRPYGQFTVISTLDGRYYTLYAHQDTINENIRGRGKIDRGEIIGTMGNTGNSFGAHLHYEVRDCGSNQDFRKTYRECKIINPFSLNEIIKNNYVGVDPRKTGAVYAGTLDKKTSTESADSLAKSLKSTYDQFCSSTKLLFAGRDLTCKEVFPIVYQNRSNAHYPDIPGKQDGAAGEKYVFATYGLKKEDMTIEKIISISTLDGIKLVGLSPDKFYTEIGKTVSYGKYQNSSKIYRKQEFFSSGNESAKVELTFLSDLVDDLEKLKKRNGSIEKAYEAYYPSSGYRKPTDNPHLYNMYDSNSIFLTLMDDSGKPLGIFREQGLMTIYKNL